MKKHISFTLFLFFNFYILWGQTSNQDINNALQICDTTESISYIPDGFGNVDDLSDNSAKGCLTSGEQNSIWFKVILESSGQFGFDIIPTNGDFDFAVYQNINTNNVLTSTPIRCSFASSVNTGIGETGDSETSEDRTGDGYVSWINGTSGSTYYILVNTGDSAINSFTINLTQPSDSNASFECPPLDCPITIASDGDKTFCSNQGNREISVTTNAETVNWYDAQTDGNLVGTGNPLVLTPGTVAPTGGIEVYWAEGSSSQCDEVSERISVSVTTSSEAIPTLTRTEDSPEVYYRCLDEETVILRVESNAKDANIKWYDNNNFNTVIATGKEIKISSFANNRTYSVIAESDSHICTSEVLNIRVSNVTIRLARGNDKYPICQNIPTKISLIYQNATSIKWYNDQDVLQFESEGSNGVWETNIPGNYHAIAENNTATKGICYSNSFDIEVRNDQAPDNIPSPEIIEYCPSNGGLILEIPLNFEGAGDTTVTWYDAEIGGVLIGQGNPFTVDNPEKLDGTYWAEVQSSFFCEQPARISVNFKAEAGTPTISVNETFGFCPSDSETTISIESSTTDDKIFWYLDKQATQPLLKPDGTQQIGKSITVTEAKTYWVQAMGSAGCNSATTPVKVTNFETPILSLSSDQAYICEGDLESQTITLLYTSTASNPISVIWYSDTSASTVITDIIQQGNSKNFNIPSKYTNSNIYVRVQNVIGCLSEILPIEVVDSERPTVEAISDLNPFFCEEVDPEPLEAKTNTDTTTSIYEIIWYNENNIERERTKNDETFAPFPEDFANNETTIYFAQAINLTTGCASERIQYTLTKSPTPTISSTSGSTYKYCRGSSFEQLEVAITNGDPNFVKWYLASDTTLSSPIGSGTKLTIIDTKNNINLAPNTFVATTSFDGKNCTSVPLSIEAIELDISDAIIETPFLTLFEGDTLELDVSKTGDTYLWTGPNGFTSDLQNPKLENITLDGAGQYNVLITNKCEFRSHSININVIQNAENAIGDNIIFCENDTRTQTVSIANIYPSSYEIKWLGAKGFNSTDTQLSFTIDDIGRYLLTVTTDEGHTSTGSLAVVPSTLDLQDENVKTCYNQVLLQPIAGLLPYEYSLDNSAFQASPIFTDISSGFHTYTVRDANGCEVSTSQTTTPFILRKAFTPNGDSFNEEWDLSDLQGCSNINIKIFDRFGRFLHQMNQNNLVWDGTIKGKPLPDNTYWYVIEFNDGSTPTLKGHITIRRNKN